MKPQELITKMTNRLNALVTTLKKLEKYFTKKEVNNKILRIILKKDWKSQVNSIEEAQDLTTLDSKLLGFEFIKEFYESDNDFSNMFITCANGAVSNNFYVFEGFLFKKNRLCIPNCSLRAVLVKEAHGGSLMGILGCKRLMIF